MTEAHFENTISKDAIRIVTKVIGKTYTIIFTDFLRDDTEGGEQLLGQVRYGSGNIYILTTAYRPKDRVLGALIHELTHAYDQEVYGRGNPFVSEIEKLAEFVENWGREVITTADKVFAEYLLKKEQANVNLDSSNTHSTPHN